MLASIRERERESSRADATLGGSSLFQSLAGLFRALPGCVFALQDGREPGHVGREAGTGTASNRCFGTLLLLLKSDLRFALPGLDSDDGESS